ncbi:MAG: hypothetical protein KDA37_08305, partial [Planctomycetales bacterium]|nr:hypothetical protein [Planctomycetales bacterium]
MLLAAAMGSVLACAGAAWAVDPLLFDGGSSTLVVDAFPGDAGGGWSTPWTVSPTANGTPVVVGSSPLTREGGIYLSVDLTGSDRNIIRQYGNTPEFNVASRHTISWDWRLDSEFVVDNQYDRINFFANASPSSSSTTSSNSWIIGVAPTLMGFDEFYFYDNNGDSSFGPQNAVNTGITLRQGVTYTFSVTVDPVAGLYGASISNGTHVYAAEDLSFRSPSTSSTCLHFGGKVSTGSKPLRYSLDSVVVSGGSPDVET